MVLLPAAKGSKNSVQEGLRSCILSERGQEAGTCLQAAFIQQAHCFHLDAVFWGVFFRVVWLIASLQADGDAFDQFLSQ